MQAFFTEPIYRIEFARLTVFIWYLTVYLHIWTIYKNCCKLIPCRRQENVLHVTKYIYISDVTNFRINKDFINSVNKPPRPYKRYNLLKKLISETFTLHLMLIQLHNTHTTTLGACQLELKQLCICLAKDIGILK